MEIENIVFEGGGVLGLAYIGCIKYLEEHDLLKNVKKISGSSIGGLFATSIAVGVSSDKLENILKNKNFKEFKDGSKLIFPNIFRLIFKGGYYKGDDLNNWLKKLFKIYVGKEDITFKEIYDIFGKELILTGSNMDKAKIEYFNKDTHPDMSVRLALRITMSIPYVFKYIKYNNDTYIDGGILDNYPIKYFKDYEKTIGFKLLRINEKPDDIIYYTDVSTKNILYLSYNIIKAYDKQLERIHVDDKYWEKTIPIYITDISSLNFELNNIQKNELIKLGYESTKKYFNL